MANFLYDDFKEQLLISNTFDLDTNTIMVAIYATEDYNPAASHTNFSAFPFNNYGSSTDYTLANKVVSAAGVFDDTVQATFSSVAADGTKDVDGLIIYQDGGTDTTRLYIANIDSFTSVTPNGGDITITWHGSGIFAL